MKGIKMYIKQTMSNFFKELFGDPNKIEEQKVKEQKAEKKVEKNNSYYSLDILYSIPTIRHPDGVSQKVALSFDLDGRHYDYSYSEFDDVAWLNIDNAIQVTDRRRFYGRHGSHTYTFITPDGRKDIGEFELKQSINADSFKFWTSLYPAFEYIRNWRFQEKNKIDSSVSSYLKKYDVSHIAQITSKEELAIYLSSSTAVERYAAADRYKELYGEKQ